ncbi:MAG: HNH endonuclease [Ferruginibacter sp.]|nr:HNH endonuclease [Rhodoferax sp.]
MSRNTARYAAFSIPATSFGGSDGMAPAMSVTLRVPRPLTPIRAAAPCESGTAVVHQAQLELFMGWYEERFIPSSTRTECACLNCMRPFWLPKSEVSRRQTCGKECRLAHEAQKKKARECACLHCGVAFTPRTTQVNLNQGKYCSLACSTKAIGQLWTPDARVKAVSAVAKSIEDGLFTPKKGVLHPQWTGGYEAARDRSRLSGKDSERTRNYRKNNPEKVREFSSKRRGLKTGALPSGTVSRIGMLQRWMCAICTAGIKGKFHADHITPLARGGKHEPLNIQLLCPTCNVRKSAKDPIDYMQSRGFLL